MLRLGVISDTHGLLRPEAEQRLAGVDHIIHAGDIGRPEIIERLRAIAPVTAIRGNVDKAPWANMFRETETVRLGGHAIHILHDINDLLFDPAARGIDIVVSGHSHKPLIERRGDALYLNPGSAGPRRFNLPITLATLDLTADRAEARLHHLASGG